MENHFTLSFSLSLFSLPSSSPILSRFSLISPSLRASRPSSRCYPPLISPPVGFPCHRRRRHHGDRIRRATKAYYSDASGGQQKHIILIHGACLGAWCWYKLKPLLERAGHRVTAVDLAASGINMKTIHELQSLRDYTEPLLQLMETLPPEEKVVVVGHSLGGLSLALAMEKFPQRIEAAIFLSAFMPDTVHQPSYILEQFSLEMPEGGWLDTQFACRGKPEESLTTMFFGPKFLSLIYDPAPAEDFELAMLLRRPSSFFLHDLSKAKKFSADRYGLVKRVFVVCEEDKAIPVNFQRWMINNSGVKQVKELKGSGHMPMLSMPKKLCDCLVDIVAEKCA